MSFGLYCIYGVAGIRPVDSAPILAYPVSDATKKQNHKRQHTHTVNELIHGYFLFR